MSLLNLLSKAKSKFIDDQKDQVVLNNLEERTRELENIKDLMSGEGGKSLKKMIISDFFFALDNLFSSQEPKYIAELQAIMNIIKKLSVDRELDQIKAYLEDKLK
jgi:hypothetical protein